MKTKIITIIASVMFFNMSIQAMIIKTYCEDKEECIRTESGIFNEDYLFTGPELNFSGEAEDLIFLGKRLTFDGKTRLGLFTLCGKLIYSGTSGNGIIAAGGEIVINGRISNNSYIACKSFNLSDKGEINGTIFVVTAKLSINGKINGDIYAGAGEIVINNEIHGNVKAYGGRIIFGEKGKIIGNLVYYAKEKLSDKELSKVTGTAKFDESHKKDLQDWDSFIDFKKSIGFLIGLGLFISFIFTGCVILFLPAFRKLDAEQSSKAFWKTSLWGLIPVLMYPAIIVLGLVMIITIPFSIMLIFAFIPLFFISNIIGTALIGKYLVNRFNWNVTKRHYQFLIGMTACAILSIIPLVNFLIFIFVSSLGWGVYISFLFNKNLTAAE